MKIANGTYLVIEGNIGAGKTSLTRLLSDELAGELILESFDENPFLPLFYQDAERYSLAVELFFMTERQKQLQNLLLENNLLEKYVIADYIFSKTLLFAQRNLSGHELELFERLFHSLNATFPKPDLLVYLHRPVEELLQNIKLRNRSYEQNITGAYLSRIEQAYTSFFEKHQHDLPILWLDIAERDFVNNPLHYQKIADLLAQPYSAGIHRFRLS